MQVTMGTVDTYANSGHQVLFPPPPSLVPGTRLGTCMHPHGELYKSTITVTNSKIRSQYRLLQTAAPMVRKVDAEIELTRVNSLRLASLLS